MSQPFHRDAGLELGLPHAPTAAVRAKIRAHIVENLLLGAEQELSDTASLIDAGILDSTGAMELVAFIEAEFAITVDDEELTPENLDSIANICALVERKLTGQ